MKLTIIAFSILLSSQSWAFDQQVKNSYLAALRIVDQKVKEIDHLLIECSFEMNRVYSEDPFADIVDTEDTNTDSVAHFNNNRKKKLRNCWDQGNLGVDSLSQVIDRNPVLKGRTLFKSNIEVYTDLDFVISDFADHRLVILSNQGEETFRLLYQIKAKLNEVNKLIFTLNNDFAVILGIDGTELSKSFTKVNSLIDNLEIKKDPLEILASNNPEEVLAILFQIEVRFPKKTGVN